jgi:5-methylcytosine-specific restriction endonuclease McrA
MSHSRILEIPKHLHGIGSGRSLAELPERKRRVWEMTGGRCFYCGIALDPGCFDSDHVIPKSRGGRHLSRNIVPACRSCNSQKRNRTVEEFRLFLMARHDCGEWVFWSETTDLLR